MNARASRWIVLALIFVAPAALAAHADLSKKVVSAFKGQILVTEGALTPGASDKETIAAFKKQRIKELRGESNDDKVTTWQFHYTAFLKDSGAKSLSLEFRADDKTSASHSIEGADPKQNVLEGDITMTEDDGLSKGKTYTLQLVKKIKGMEPVVLATTTLTMK